MPPRDTVQKLMENGQPSGNILRAGSTPSESQAVSEERNPSSLPPRVPLPILPNWLNYSSLWSALLGFCCQGQRGRAASKGSGPWSWGGWHGRRQVPRTGKQSRLVAVTGNRHQSRLPGKSIMKGQKEAKPGSQASKAVSKLTKYVVTHRCTYNIARAKTWAPMQLTNQG